MPNVCPPVPLFGSAARKKLGDPTSSRCFDFLDEFLGLNLSRDSRVSVPACSQRETQPFSAAFLGAASLRAVDVTESHADFRKSAPQTDTCKKGLSFATVRFPDLRRPSPNQRHQIRPPRAAILNRPQQRRCRRLEVHLRASSQAIRAAN